MSLDFGSQWPILQLLLRERLSDVEAADVYNRPNFFVTRAAVTGLQRRALTIRKALLTSPALHRSEIPSVQDLQDVARGWPLSLFCIARIARALAHIASSRDELLMQTTLSNARCVTLPDECVTPSMRYIRGQTLTTYRHQLAKTSKCLATVMFGAKFPYIWDQLETGQYRVTTATATTIHDYVSTRINDVPALDVVFPAGTTGDHPSRPLMRNQGNILPD